MHPLAFHHEDKSIRWNWNQMWGGKKAKIIQQCPKDFQYLPTHICTNKSDGGWFGWLVLWLKIAYIVRKTFDVMEGSTLNEILFFRSFPFNFTYFLWYEGQWMILSSFLFNLKNLIRLNERIRTILIVMSVVWMHSMIRLKFIVSWQIAIWIGFFSVRCCQSNQTNQHSENGGERKTKDQPQLEQFHLWWFSFFRFHSFPFPFSSRCNFSCDLKFILGHIFLLRI